MAKAKQTEMESLDKLKDAVMSLMKILLYSFKTVEIERLGVKGIFKNAVAHMCYTPLEMHKIMHYTALQKTLGSHLSDLQSLFSTDYADLGWLNFPTYNSNVGRIVRWILTRTVERKDMYMSDLMQTESFSFSSNFPMYTVYDGYMKEARINAMRHMTDLISNATSVMIALENAGYDSKVVMKED